MSGAGRETAVRESAPVKGGNEGQGALSAAHRPSLLSRLWHALRSLVGFPPAQQDVQSTAHIRAFAKRFNEKEVELAELRRDRRRA